MSLIFFLSIFFCFYVSLAVGRQGGAKTAQTYIVHVRQTPGSAKFASFAERARWYKSFLPVGDRLIYSYDGVINGFAATLTDEELAVMRRKVGFIDARPDRILSLHTTHTPSFLGLTRDAPGLWKDANYGRGVTVGVLDSGISPRHPSFSDDGMQPPPPRWKGRCAFNASDCNNKLIGIRAFLRGLDNATISPYDDDGHGTHVASTAAGMFVDNANVNGLANGTASGIAPYAHLAVYKVCRQNRCSLSDVLAGMDSAVSDGVDVLSLSLGGLSLPFYDDDLAIAALGAVEKGVFVSCAAGNSGPSNGTTANEAPWVLTVGASTMDRSVRATVELGNNISTFYGESLYQPNNFSAIPLPLIYPGLRGGLKTPYCLNGSLDRVDVRGKIVVCDAGAVPTVAKGRVVKAAGGLGMIIAYSQAAGFSTLEYPHVLPASEVGYTDGLLVKAYAITASAPTASILFERTIIGTKPAPALVYFSSRGPNQADPNILKPDIIGPGVNVLAAWPFRVGSSDSGSYFNVISGTSMATPHLSGVAALLKSTHPDWSPAAVKSAIMTTATLIGNDNNPIIDETSGPADLFGIGAGHVNPWKANNPGLIYDIKFEDYVRYLCGLNYTNSQVTTVARRSVDCSAVGAITGQNLNYPSFAVTLNVNSSYASQVSRTVRNVGAPNSTYTVETSIADQVKVEVRPAMLSFSRANEEATYSVTFTGNSNLIGKVFQGHLTWVSTDKSIVVRSPVVIAIV